MLEELVHAVTFSLDQYHIFFLLEAEFFFREAFQECFVDTLGHDRFWLFLGSACAILHLLVGVELWTSWSLELLAEDGDLLLVGLLDALLLRWSKVF